MVIDYFMTEEFENENSLGKKVKGYGIKPRSKLFRKETDSIISKFSNNFTVKVTKDKLKKQKGYERESLVDASYISRILEVQEPYEYEETVRNGIFKKTKVKKVGVKTKSKSEPLMEGVYIVGYVTDLGTIWYTEGYDRLVLDQKTGLPELVRQPNTLDEAFELIMADPRYIEHLDPYSEYLRLPSAVKNLMRTVSKSVQNILEYQSLHGVKFDEKEHEIRKNFVASVTEKAEAFLAKYFEVLETLENSKVEF